MEKRISNGAINKKSHAGVRMRIEHHLCSVQLTIEQRCRLYGGVGVRNISYELCMQEFPLATLICIIFEQIQLTIIYCLAIANRYMMRRMLPYPPFRCYVMPSMTFCPSGHCHALLVSQKSDKSTGEFQCQHWWEEEPPDLVACQHTIRWTFKAHPNSVENTRRKF